MKKPIILLISIMAATLANQLQAQTKPVARKSVTRTTSSRSNTTPLTTSPVKKEAPAASFTRSQPAPETPAKATTYSAPATPLRATTTYQTPARRPVASGKANDSRFQMGVRFGINSTLITGFDFSSIGTGLQQARVTGFHGGVVFNLGGPNFSVQPEILFSQYGIRMTAEPDYIQLKYNLLEVPVMLKATFGQSDLRFFVNAGPVVSYTMGGTLTFLNGSQSGSQEIDMTGSGRLSYGAAGGTGIALKAGPGTVMLEGRYTYLFSSNENNAKLNPQNFMGSIGYLIPLGGR